MWEYRIVVANGVLSLTQLNEMGQDGWELVDVIQWPSQIVPNQYALHYHFKRPVGIQGEKVPIKKQQLSVVSPHSDSSHGSDKAKGTDEIKVNRE
jgi:hypothetical protein